MCEIRDGVKQKGIGSKVVPVNESAGTVLAHDITEIRPGEFKGRAFRKGHVVRDEDIPRLRRLGKEHLFILEVHEDEMHENDAAYAMARALSGEGVVPGGEPEEGKISLVAAVDGVLSVDRSALLRFNLLGDVMCATLHDSTVVRKGQTVAGTRAIPLIVRKTVVEEALKVAGMSGGVLRVRQMRRPRAGIVITGNEVYHGRIKDGFRAVIEAKIEKFNGDIVGVHLAPDDASFIEARIMELIGRGADIIITTGGMSVDPDDVTRFAVRNLDAEEITYGSPVLPGSMFLVAYLDGIPIIGVPACGMYADITVFDLVLPRVLAGEKITRKEIAALGHGGLCMKCERCRYPRCPFGK